jgi:glycosyltransferase involved in cell wall biosynthesis
VNAGATATRVILLPSYPWNPYQRLLAKALDGEGISAVALASWPRRAPLLGAWWANGRPDVVHVHWIHEFLGGSRGAPSRRTVRWFDWQLRILRALRVRIVWTVHNLEGHEADGGGRAAEGARRDAAAHRAIIEHADAIILHCLAARDGLISRYEPSASARARMHVLPHGNYVRHYVVDLDPDQAREELDLGSGGPVFAFVGSIRGYKGVEELVRAFSGTPALGPAARLLICGKPLPARIGRELRRPTSRASCAPPMRSCCRSATS